MFRFVFALEIVRHTHDTNELWENIFFRNFSSMAFSSLFASIQCHSIDWITDQINLLLSSSLLACNRFGKKKRNLWPSFDWKGFDYTPRSLFQALNRFRWRQKHGNANDICAQWMCGLNSGRRFSECTLSKVVRLR